jgi:multidrug efflux pump subunit AcrA (membrane-fusion protein)
MNEPRPEPPSTFTPPSSAGSVSPTPNAAPAFPATTLELTDLLAAQCLTAPADAAALVRLASPSIASSAPRDAHVIAMHPAPRRGQSAPAWLAQAIPAAAQRFASAASSVPEPPGPVLIPLDTASPDFAAVGPASVIAIPAGAPATTLALFLVRAPQHAVGLVIERLALTTRLLDAFALRHNLAAAHDREATLRAVLDIVAALGEHDRFAPAITAFLAALAASFSAQRVSLGVARGRNIRLDAITNTDKLVRTTRLAQDIAAAMEEAADQDLDIAFPLSAADTVIARAHADLAARHNSVAILSAPVRRDGVVIAVLTLERDQGPPFTELDAARLRLICELAAGRLASLDRHARWLGPRLIAASRDAMALILGPRHTWLKLTVALVIAAALALALVPMTDRVDASFRIEAAQRHVIPAPYDGFVRDVLAKPGDIVAAGDTLARLDDAELRLQLAAAQADLAAHLREVTIAQRERNEASAQVARARADQSRARIDLYQHQIDRALLTAPAPGVILRGDADRLRGGPVRTGDVLLELAPLDALLADAYVTEDRIAAIAPGQQGTIAAASFPGERIAVVVERISPAAELRAGRNVFRVTLRLASQPDWLRPGMEGLARIDVDTRSAGAVLTRGLIDWIRMRLWL